MKSNRYTLVEDNTNDKIAYLDFDKITGFSFKPKNNIAYDGITVNRAVIVKPSFIEKILKKKNKKQLELYLQYIIGILDSDDSDAGEIASALDNLSRYRTMIINTYSKYLDVKYTELLIKKVELIERELKMKMIMFKPIVEETTRKSR